MASIQKLSESVVDYAERVSDMADAAQGRRHKPVARMSRWLLLPASGAAVLAVVRSDYFSRQAKGVVDEAKDRASELPDDLMKRVRQFADGSQSRRQPQRRSTSTRRNRSRNGTSRVSKSRAATTRSR
jgi:hypothetical protein